MLSLRHIFPIQEADVVLVDIDEDQIWKNMNDCFFH